MIVVPGPSSKKLGVKVADCLNAELISLEYKIFPDGENYFRIGGSVQGRKVFLIQTTSPPQDRCFIQLFLLAQTIKNYGAESVVAVVPYLAYARQDKRFLEGEALSIDVIIRLIEASGIDGLLTFDIHSSVILKRFNIPAISISAIPLIAKYLKTQGLGGAFSLAPDKGAIDLARIGGEILGGGYNFLEKTRDRETGETRILEKDLPVEGKNVIIFDDIISTGGTIAVAAKIAKNCGAKKIIAACTHPLLVGNAFNKIISSGVSEIVGTDAIPGRYSSISLAPLIVNELRKWV